MKMMKILQAVFLFSILIIAVSCRSSRPVYESRYPSRQYPTYPPPPPPNYPVYSDRMPPGQAKKIYGGRSARPYAPGQRKKYGYSYRRYPLIIIRTPDIIISRYNDGRYFYRNPDGYIYWRGYDDRYYLDEKHLDNNGYDDNEYNDWKYKGQNKNDNYKSKGKGKGKWKG